MKRSVIMLAFLTTVCAGYSQPGSVNKKDTCVCVSPSEIINAIRADDSLQVSKEIIKSQDVLIKEMSAGLKKTDSIIKKQDDLHLADRRIIDNLDRQNSTLNKSNQLSLDYNSYLKKQIKKERKKTILISGISVSVITGLSYLLITK